MLDGKYGVVAMARTEWVNSVEDVYKLVCFVGCFDSVSLTHRWPWVLQESCIRLTELEDNLSAVGAA